MDTILPYPAHLELLRLTATVQTITAVMCPLQSGNACPLCHQMSSRVHSRYVRHLLDLPWHHVSLRLELHVRRFFCDTPDCPRQIFTERLPAVVAPYARRTTALDTWFSLVGLAVGGEAGARLLRALGITTSPDTLLTQVRSLSIPAFPRHAWWGLMSLPSGVVASLGRSSSIWRRIVPLRFCPIANWQL